MFYLISLFWILSISGLLTIVFKKRFEMVVTISFVGGTLLLYLFAFFSQIRLAYYLSWLFVIVFWIVIIKWIVNKDNRLIEFKNNYFGVGIIVFVGLCIFAFFLYRFKGFANCDEFSHWGPMLKETLRLNGFYAQDASKLMMHKDYPPFFSLLEMLWLGFGGFKYHEAYAYIALFVFMFSMYMPLFSNLRINCLKDWIKGLFILLGIIAVGLTIDKTNTISDTAFVYNSIYIDWSLAVFVAYGFYIVYKEEWSTFKFVVLTLVFVSLLLMKQIGIAFYLLILFYAFLKVLFVDKKLDKKVLIKSVVCFAVIPVLIYLSWKYVINTYGINGQFEVGSINIKDFINIVKGNTDLQWKHDTFVNYCSALIHRVLVLHPFEMTYFVCVLLIGIGLLGLFVFKKESICLSGTYLIGACGYVFVMMILYTLSFSIDEAPYLASFDRYMVTYLYFGIVLLMMLAYDRFNKYVFADIVIFALICLFVEPKTLDDIMPKASVSDEYSKIEKIFVVEQFTDGTEFNREEVNGLKLEFNRPGYIDMWDPDYEKFKSYIDDADGIYIIGYDDIILDYWNRLGIEDELANGSYYSIDKETSNIYNTSFTYIHYVIMYYAM